MSDRGRRRRLRTGLARRSSPVSSSPPPPMPPPELRRLTGRADEAEFDNLSGDLVYPDLPEGAYESVLDFGCGCGRFARKLLQQRQGPSSYVGIDLHEPSVRWCHEHLTPIEPLFSFRHHDVANARLNPGPGRPPVLSFPVADRSITLLEAWSVFTHLTQTQAEFYLNEVARVLRRGGLLHATWFLFDRADYPMLQPEQASLYTSEHDLSAAVLYERRWLETAHERAGLTIVGVRSALERPVWGHQWLVLAKVAGSGVEGVPIPPDPYQRGGPVLPG